MMARLNVFFAILISLSSGLLHFHQPSVLMGKFCRPFVLVGSSVLFVLCVARQVDGCIFWLGWQGPLF